MMFQNEKTSQPTESFSRAMQRRMEMMLQDANRLFSLGWLRKQLWKKLTGYINDEPANEFGDYRKILMGTPESRFAWEFLSVYRKSLPDIRKKIENAFEGTNPLEELLEEREELIMEFARMSLSKAWEKVGDDILSWRNFAHRMPFDDVSRKDEIPRFFEIIDRISVITDIACGHAKAYGLEVDRSCMKGYNAIQLRVKLTDELLVQAIEKWSVYLNTQSAWAVVYCVLRDDFGYTNVAQFERDIVQLPFNKKLPDCPKDTVSKTLSNNPYMRKAISAWPPDKGFTKAAQALRDALEQVLT